MTATAPDATKSPPARFLDLSARALLGADRAGAAAGGGEAASAAMLRDAALLGAKSRAGFKAQRSASVPSLCPDDPVPTVGRASAATLARLLADPDGDLIVEWAELAIQHRKRAPDALIPALLDWCVAHRNICAPVRRVTGVKGDWLSAMNPKWSGGPALKALPADVDSAWQTGNAAERRALLATIRSVEPSRADSLLRSTWSSDSADDRRRFIELLETGLSPADEPLLEWALDDRSKLVRQSASALLVRLPGSALVARMTAAARAMLTAEAGKKKLLRKSAPKLTIEPPTEFDPVWERDGIDEKPPSGVGKRAWWLRQIIARTPPSLLHADAALSASEFLEAVAESDYAKDMIIALTESSVLAADAVFCAALLKHRLEHKTAHAIESAPLWKAIPPAHREAVLLEALALTKLTWKEHWSVLGGSDMHWSPAFSQAACKLLTNSLPAKPLDWYVVGSDLDSISRQIHPSALEAFESLIRAGFKDDPTASIIRSLDRVRLRADMHKEFAS